MMNAKADRALFAAVARLRLAIERRFGGASRIDAQGMADLVGLLDTTGTLLVELRTERDRIGRKLEGSFASSKALSAYGQAKRLARKLP